MSCGATGRAPRGRSGAGGRRRSLAAGRWPGRVDRSSRSSGSTMAPSLPILVVEDEESLLDLMVLALGGRFGYPVVRARDGEEALVRAREGRPGVVVLDLNLPKVDGYEVARRLRADPATAHAWIIAISGLGHPDAAAAAGCDQFLWKPIGIDQLELAVRAGAGRAGERWNAAGDQRHQPLPPARPVARTDLAVAAAALLDRVG